MAAMIEAANVHPNYLGRQSIKAEDLRRLSEPCVIFEHEWLDEGGSRCFAFTVGGWLDGRPLGGLQGGATVGGEVMIVHADSVEAAKHLAALGLQDTISALDGEEQAYIEAHAALARLSQVSPVLRMDKAAAAPADKSDAFEADSAAIRKLRGDDIVLTTGGIEQPPA
jgi:hypothetical protein